MIIEDALARLSQDPLRHITPIKFLALYRSAAKCEWFGDVLLATVPAQISQYDRTTYPDATLIAYPALLHGCDEHMIDQCVSALAARAATDVVVCKTLDERLITALKR